MQLLEFSSCLIIKLDPIKPHPPVTEYFFHIIKLLILILITIYNLELR